MAGEWRVSLIVRSPSRGRGRHHSRYRTKIRDLLRDRLGGDVAIADVGKTIFLYAGDATKAEWAGRVAQEALAEENLAADVRLAQWDPAQGEWQDPRTGTVDRTGAENQWQGPRDSAGRPVHGMAEEIFDWLTFDLFRRD